MTGIKKFLNAYVFVILTCSIIIFCLLVSYLKDTKKLYQETLDNFYKAILSVQEERIKEIVNRTIHDIDAERNRFIQINQTFFEQIKPVLDRMATTDDIGRIVTALEGSQLNMDAQLNARCFIWNKVKKLVEYSTDSLISVGSTMEESDVLDYINQYEIMSMSDSKKGNYWVILGVTKDDLEHCIKDLAQYKVKNTVLSQGGYIWINEIINYEGGEGYARRLVHPNLIKTEGKLLSTDMKDSAGNFPYLKELNDIKKSGESINKYYFKKINSNEVSLKLSYAKLYPRYNWVIGTGVHLDDLEAYTYRHNENFKQELEKQIKVTLVNTIILFFAAGATGWMLINYYQLKKKSLLRAKNNLIKQQYHLLERKYDKANMVLHDIRNHLVCIQELVRDTEDRKVIQYLESVNQDINKLGYTIITGNKVLDIILNEKIEQMSNYKIDFSHNIETIDVEFIDNKDLVSVLSNIFNNAIENTIVSTDKTISFILYDFNNAFIVIKVVNSCDSKPTVKRKKLITTKKDKESHGYGMKIISKTVEKYDGDIRWDYDEQRKEFSIMVMIPKIKK
ncbi:MAG: cache domain-containing protein [Cellulosilyticaceae bacterium]